MDKQKKTHNKQNGAWVILARLSNSAEASLIKNDLEINGIDCVVYEPERLSWNITMPLINDILIRVRATDLQKAREAMGENDFPDDSTEDQKYEPPTKWQSFFARILRRAKLLS
jgi:hypothetical protein